MAATLKFNRLVADNIQEDGRFDDNVDEVYFKVHDNGASPPPDEDPRTNIINMHPHEEFKGMTDKFSFTGSAVVELWEEDPASPDDFIASFEIKEKAIHDDHPFLNEGVRYVLNYDVM